MARLKLELIGFEIHDPALARGTRSLGRDLARWQALETEQPGLFQTMYQFWCRPAR